MIALETPHLLHLRQKFEIEIHTWEKSFWQSCISRHNALTWSIGHWPFVNPLRHKNNCNVWFGTFPKNSSDFENPGFPYFPVMDRLLQRVLHTKRAFAWHQLFARPASSTTMCFDLVHRQWWWWWWSYIWCAMLSIVLWDWQTTKRKTTKNIHPPTCSLDKWREEGRATNQRQGVIANTYINL